VTRRLRTDGVDVPVIFLTARSATEDRVGGLRLGADDYLTKPFSVEELVERVRAVLRRTRGAVGGSGLRFADLELDQDSHEVFRAGQPVKVTALEFRVLRYFLLNPKRVLSKAQIMAHVWDFDFGASSNLIEVYISNLRRKIDHVEPALIHTVRSAGYVLRLPG
jgi:two-component system, OmpR family, response regulator